MDANLTTSTAPTGRAADARAEPTPTTTSLRALDGLNFFLADVRDGMGPFLGTFLRDSQHWEAGRVGLALAASQFGTVLAQTPVGGLIDQIRWKRLAVGLAAAVVATCCVLLYLIPTPAAVLINQTLIGVAGSVFSPAIAALTLGVVGRRAMARFLVAVQLLDGIGAGIFGVVTVLVVADLTRGTGRFNFTQGVLATATGVGSGASNLLAGYIVQAAGFNAGFVTLAGLATLGLTFYGLLMPETRELATAEPHE